jgi:hypothetical protein
MKALMDRPGMWVRSLERNKDAFAVNRLASRHSRMGMSWQNERPQRRALRTLLRVITT